MIQFIKGIQHFIDRGCSFNKTKTKYKKMKNLIKAYNGPIFLIDLRYA